MPKLLRETLSSQETAQQTVEGLCRRVKKTRPLAVKKMMGDFFDYQLFFIFAKNISQ